MSAPSHPVTTKSASVVKSASNIVTSSKGLSRNKSIGVAIWLVGAWLTSQTISQLGVPEPFSYMFGIFVQLVLTRAESPIFRGRGYPKMAVGALLVDVFVTNMPGALLYTRNVGNTDFWNMLKSLTEKPNLEATSATQASLAIGIATFTAAAAEYFWNLPD